MIDHYEFGSITIDGKRYDHDVIIFKGLVRSWWRVEGHNVSIKDVEVLVGEGAKTIVFGTGASGVMKVSSEVEEYLKKNGIEVLKSLTGDAVSKFNKLSSDPTTAAALHLTC
jgi:hypothetical protein